MKVIYDRNKDEATDRVFRGGAFIPPVAGGDPVDLRAASRGSLLPGVDDDDIGFRIIRKL